MNKIYIIQVKMCTIDCIEKLMVDLRTLGKIEEGKKINTKEKYISSDDTTFFQPLWRWYRGDSRMSTGNKIQSTLGCASNIIAKAIQDMKNNDNEPKILYLNVPPNKFLDDIRSVLKGANKGIKNLRDTYIQDDTLSSKLELHIQTIDRQIESIDETLGNTHSESEAKKERRFSFSGNNKKNKTIKG